VAPPLVQCPFVGTCSSSLRHAGHDCAACRQTPGANSACVSDADPTDSTGHLSLYVQSSNPSGLTCEHHTLLALFPTRQNSAIVVSGVPNTDCVSSCRSAARGILYEPIDCKSGIQRNIHLPNDLPHDKYRIVGAFAFYRRSRGDMTYLAYEPHHQYFARMPTILLPL